MDSGQINGTGSLEDTTEEFQSSVFGIRRMIFDEDFRSCVIRGYP